MLMIRSRSKGAAVRGAAAHLEAMRPSAATAAPHVAATKPLYRAQALAGLCSKALTRTAGTAALGARLLPQASRGDVLAEWVDFQLAVVQRAAQMQQGWSESWQIWLRELAELPLADTLSEHIEQQYNLGERFTAQLKTQAADSIEFAENVQVDFAYWVERKARGSAPTVSPPAG